MYTHVALHRIKVALKELGLLLFYHAPMFVCLFVFNPRSSSFYTYVFKFYY